MAFVDEAVAKEYRDAWDAWQKQVESVHRVFLEGETLRPDALKGLLNRESRAKDRYDAARLKLLGLEASPIGDSGDNPFR